MQIFAGLHVDTNLQEDKQLFVMLSVVLLAAGGTGLGFFVVLVTFRNTKKNPKPS